MTNITKLALAAVFTFLPLSFEAMAKVSPDDLLSKIDKDIEAKRLSAPAGNNALQKIYLFKDIAPFDQRITARVNKVGAFYVSMAQRAINAKSYSRAQGYLNKAWSASHLTPHLSAVQDKLNGLSPSVAKQSVATGLVTAKSTSKGNTKQATKTGQRANKTKTTTASKKAAAAKRKQAQALAAQKAAKKKARQIELERQQLLAEQRKKEQEKARAEARLARLEAQRKAKLDAIRRTEKRPAIARFGLDQRIINQRSSRDMRQTLSPICQQVLDNEASVVIHTHTPQDYRWLTVRLTLCVRRLDKSFRLRHSNQILTAGDPGITLHPARTISLLNTTSR